MQKIILGSLFCLGLYAQNQVVQVYKPITSSCPQSWLDEMQKDIGSVNIVSLMDVKNLKNQIGIPQEVQSCNTTIIDDYVFEGNVPPLAIKDFFKEIPKNTIGLSLPSYENDKDEKTVFIINEDKTYKIFGKYK